jgi:ubiquitin-protein ligase E3 A
VGFQSQDLIGLCLPKEKLQQTVVEFQNYLTIVIIENNFSQDAIQAVIEVLDLYQQGNQLPARAPAQRINYAEFYNEALNKEVDLRKQAEIYIREYNKVKAAGQQFDRFGFFTLFNYPWTLNAYKKAELFRELYQMQRHQHITQAMMSNLGDLFNPNSRGLNIDNIIANSHFTIEIRRDNILEDCLNALVGEKAASSLNQPLRVVFKNEPAIDEGGVKKEFFQLVFKELFKPDYGMFNYNPEARVYWFNGYSFESRVNFYLVGVLMGLAANNQVIIDIPILSTCYKYLLEQEADFADLELWQPEVA